MLLIQQDNNWSWNDHMETFYLLSSCRQEGCQAFDILGGCRTTGLQQLCFPLFSVTKGSQLLWARIIFSIRKAHVHLINIRFNTIQVICSGAVLIRAGQGTFLSGLLSVTAKVNDLSTWLCCLFPGQADRGNDDFTFLFSYHSSSGRPSHLVTIRQCHWMMLDMCGCMVNQVQFI